MPFTVSDLLLTEEKLSLLTAALANTGQSDPLGTAIAEAESTVARHTAGFALGDSDSKSLVRRIALRNAYAIAGPVPPEIQSGYDDAMKDLRDIRDGKFARSSEVDTGAGGGNWGADDKIKPR